MLDILRDLQARTSRLDKEVRAIKADRVSRQDIRDNAKALVDAYFRTGREKFTRVGVPSDVIATCDASMHALLEASHGRSYSSVYRDTLRNISRSLIELEKLGLLLSAGTTPEPTIDPTDEQIIVTLRNLSPSAASSYEQAARDLLGNNRLSWRGPATDLREALRELLDHLAPDDAVKGQDGFKLEPGTSGPTMKQKVRFILKARGTSKSAMQAPESAVDAVEEAVGTFVRSVYTRSSVSTHTPSDKGEVLRVRDWVRVALRELLELQ